MTQRGFSYASTLLLATVTTIACSLPVPSVYSLIPDDELVFDPVLLGHWTEVDDDSITDLYAVTQSDEDERYDVEVTTDDCEVFRFEAALADLGAARFLIMTARADELLFALPTYSFLRIEISPDVVDTTMIDPDWLNDYLESNPDALSHLWRRDADDDMDLLLTASTTDLRAFHLEHLETPDAYGEEGHFKRWSEEDAAALRSRWCDGEPENPADAAPAADSEDPEA